MQESFAYFKIFKPISWGKRPAEHRCRLIQRFLKKGTTGVRLILSGLSLTSADTAPITCNKSGEVVIVAADGTENVLTDAASNDESNSGNENAENAVIKCKDGSAVTLCGAGMGMNLSTTQAYVTFGSAGISGMGNMSGQPGSFGGMQPPQNGSQPKSDSQVSGNFQPSDDFRPGDMTSNNSMSSGGSAPSDGFGASLISAGSIMTILDPSGSTVYSGKAACRAAFVFFSSADLNTDKTYTLSADSISAATATAQNGGQPGQMPGSGSQPGQPGEGQQPGGDPPAMPGSDNSSGNAI